MFDNWFPLSWDEIRAGGGGGSHMALTVDTTLHYKRVVAVLHNLCLLAVDMRMGREVLAFLRHQNGRSSFLLCSGGKSGAVTGCCAGE